MLKPSHIAGILVLLLVASLRGPSEASGFLADYAIALICIVIFFRTYAAWTTYQSVRNLEAVDFDERKYYLSFVQEPELRATIERKLAAAQEPEPGIVETFQPSPALSRFLEWPFWIAMAIAVILLVQRLTGTPFGPVRWMSLAIAPSVAVYTWLRLRTLRHSIELTPFGIAEIHPDGSKRSLRWTAVAGVRSSRWRRILEILPGTGSGAIRISYDVTRGTRLIQLLLGYLQRPEPPAAS